MLPDRARALISSVHASYLGSELANMLTELNIKNFTINSGNFSRRTIVKNMKRLKKDAAHFGIKYSEMSQIVMVRKE